ncbi:MAG: pilus assembly protein [Solirubrobacterales bacterium]|nr:pilus assembly protein [Solirubrobacterales bacterium]
MRRRLAEQRGQALVEVVGAVPAIILVGLVLAQALAVGYSAVLAGSAAQAGALALADGRSARAAVRHAIPGWSRARVEVVSTAETVRVKLRPPSPLGVLARKLAVTAEAGVELP